MQKRVLIWSLTCFLLTVIVAASPSGAVRPGTTTYEGLAVDAAGARLTGTHSVEIHYLSQDGSEQVASETYDSVAFEKGEFTITLGSGRIAGDRAPGGLAEVFATHPELLLEVSIDGETQAPRVRVLTAGHSPASKAALSGPVGNSDEKLHFKGYEVESHLTAIQAVILRPEDGNAAGPQAVDGRTLTSPFVGQGIRLGESNPLRDMPTIDITARPDIEPVEVNRPRHEDLYDEQGRRYGTITEKIRDPLADLTAPVGGTPAPDLNFEGIGNVNGVLPPDTEGAVGPNHYLQVVNLSFAVYDKMGTLLGGPFNTNTLWAGFGGACQNDNSGDAIFLYDEQADRWVLTQFAVSSGQAVCFAVSTSPDPLGTYHLYQFDTLRFPDYFKLGVWPDPQNDAYFMSTNSGFQNQYDIYAFDRQSILAGAPTTFQAFQNYYNLMMPADVDGDALPPSGTPGIFFTFRDGGEPYFGSPPTDSLDIWEFDVDWAVPANSTFTNVQNFVPPEFAEFNWTVCGFFVQNCLPQPDTGQGLDSASWWPMQRLQYRNMGSHEALVGAWTVDVTGTPDLAAPRWFELRRPTTVAAAPEGAGWVIHQQGTYSPDSDHRFMPSVAMDGDGNIALGYSVVSSSTYPTIRYAARSTGDPLGTLQPEATLIDGTGSQTSSFARWGDYASMEVDPVDDCTFWFTTEYIETTGSAPWQTRIGTFQVPGCGGLQAEPTSQAVCTSAGSTDFDITLLDQFNGTTNMTDAGCPAGAVCSFTVNPVVFPDTMTTYQVANLAATTPGDYVMTVTATDNAVPSNTRDIDLNLSIFDMVSTGLQLDSPPDGATGVDREPTLEWSGATQAQSYDVEVATDPAFTNVVFSRSNTQNENVTVTTTLDSSTTYYWRVRANNPCGLGSWQSASFMTEAAPGDCAPGQEPLVHFFDDLEGDVSAWSSGGTNDTWAISGARTWSGSSAFNAEDLSIVSDQYLISPEIDVSGAGDTLTVQFYNHQTIEDRSGGCYDGAVLEISTDGGASWTRLESELLTDPYDGPVSDCCDNPLQNEDAWCGDPQDWVESIADIDAFAVAVAEGSTIQLRFRLGTDFTVGREGWYIDDVKVKSCVDSTTIFSDGFEGGTTDAWSDTQN